MEQDRLRIFRSMRSSVRGSDKHLLVGIGVAKSKHHAFFGTANGRTLRKTLVFDNRYTRGQLTKRKNRTQRFSAL